MIDATPERDLADVASPALAAAATAALVTLLLMQPPLSLAPQMAAPKPTQVALSVVEETPPPPPPEATPTPEPPPPPPPPKAAVSPLPPPPPPKPRHVVRPKPPQPHQAVTEEQEKPAPPRPPAETVARTATQAPENHSAEAAYIGRLHAIVARNTVPPSGAAYRLSHPSGEAEVGFTLARDGAVSDVHLIRSSGSALLDKQALAIVAGQRYPGLPDDVYPGAPSHRFSVPVAFTYAGGGDDGP